jgi:hypothetical protein
MGGVGRAKMFRGRAARGGERSGTPRPSLAAALRNVFDCRFLPDTDRVVSPPPG